MVATKCRFRVKQQAKQNFDKPSQIVSQVSSEVDVSARVHIGREESVNWILRKQRLDRIPAEQDCLQDLIIDGEWAQTSGLNP